MQHDTTIKADGAEAWMVAYMADLFDIPEDSVDLDQTFEEWGLDSAAMVAMTSDLGRFLGRELDLRLLMDHPTIRSVAAQLRAG